MLANINIVDILDFENNQKFREFLGKRISGAGPIYIHVVDDWNNPDSIIKSKHIVLTMNTCKIYKEGPFTSLILDKSILKEILDS